MSTGAALRALYDNIHEERAYQRKKYVAMQEIAVSHREYQHSIYTSTDLQDMAQSP